MTELKKLQELICEATQKTNYNCNGFCDDKGSCAYCAVIAEYLYNNKVAVLPFETGETVYDIYEAKANYGCPEIYENTVNYISVKKNKDDAQNIFTINGDFTFNYEEVNESLFTNEKDAENAQAKFLEEKNN